MPPEESLPAATFIEDLEKFRHVAPNSYCGQLGKHIVNVCSHQMQCFASESIALCNQQHAVGFLIHAYTAALTPVMSY